MVNIKISILVYLYEKWEKCRVRCVGEGRGSKAVDRPGARLVREACRGAPLLIVQYAVIYKHCRVNRKYKLAQAMSRNIF